MTMKTKTDKDAEAAFIVSVVAALVAVYGCWGYDIGLVKVIFWGMVTFLVVFIGTAILSGHD